LKKQNIENHIAIKNTMQDCGDHYAVLMVGGKEFLADKIDINFIEAFTWYCFTNKYVASHDNGPIIFFHNLILGHTPSEITVDHTNRNGLDNQRSNFRVATKNIQAINRTPRNGLNQAGVTFHNNKWFASWLEENRVQKSVCFSINKFC